MKNYEAHPCTVASNEALLGGGGGAPRVDVAYAHFKLNYPASMTCSRPRLAIQEPPCGLSDMSNTADDSTKTNAVTVVQQGTMLAVKFDETIAHPGHYRVAIAQTMAELPADPIVTPVTVGGVTDACGSAAIAPTAMPILGDGLLPARASRRRATPTCSPAG